MALPEGAVEFVSPLEVLLNMKIHENTLSNYSIVEGFRLTFENILECFEEKSSMKFLWDHLVKRHILHEGLSQ
jgi:hypothetical protein